jgi:glycine cleavage system H protein
MSADYPDDLRYTREHEWARIEGNVAQIGVTKFAVEQLGDVTMVEFPDEGDAVSKEEVFGTVESVKAVSDLYAPMTGKVVRTNTPLADTPEYINEDPYGEGWLIEIEIADPSELEGMMDAAAYEAFIAEEEA